MNPGRPEPAFEAPWHAQVFALTVHLSESGAFDWPAWAQVFGATLKDHGLGHALNGGEDYFLAWVDALEQICTQRGLIEPGVLGALKSQWERAYLATPHGYPVRLEAGA
ncbi:MAG: nitrile hydratase accessory protein [Pelagimonas sp.]|jgi:nitrile hydratase accessory protein|nr:nitrile hydratase accessory protein [Pelagimonas sp.]